jgi:hypothetical protein
MEGEEGLTDGPPYAGNLTAITVDVGGLDSSAVGNGMTRWGQPRSGLHEETANVLP